MNEFGQPALNVIHWLAKQGHSRREILWLMMGISLALEAPEYAAAIRASWPSELRETAPAAMQALIDEVPFEGVST